MKPKSDVWVWWTGRRAGMVGHAPHCTAAAVGSKQAMRRNGSCSPSWILAVKFQLISVLQDDCKMVGRKGGEDELPSLLSFHIVFVQGCFFGRCCRIAVSSVNGMRRLSPFLCQ